MSSNTDTALDGAKGSKRIKVISTFAMFGAIALQLWQVLTPLPSVLQPIDNITAVVLIIHAIEGLISAVLILRYRLSAGSMPSKSSALLTQKLPQSTPLAALKAGLYAFFVGTVGLLEIIEATKPIESTS